MHRLVSGSASSRSFGIALPQISHLRFTARFASSAQTESHITVTDVLLSIFCTGRENPVSACVNYWMKGKKRTSVRPQCRILWWAHQDSNLGPIGYEPTALPLSYGPMAPRAGFEPATHRLTAGCSTAELSRNQLAKSIIPYAHSRVNTT
jgi:hypothetical protein